ncbi:uncharacterized protein LOC107482099 [Arachis duranensis]|uniref:Uncharacterized protein LOC107482099 n=1 Tax=Arachis duranensis TaxID=130453 RepID=A0A6P5N9I2_ARADU|nr:uncharacterized protein LOC107482099 [Arachis duranensis]
MESNFESPLFHRVGSQPLHHTMCLLRCTIIHHPGCRSMIVNGRKKNGVEEHDSFGHGFTTLASLTPIHIASRRFRPPQPPTSCSHHESTPSHDHQEPPPQQPSEVSKSGGAHAGYDEWLALDQKVNSYPSVRGFTAIGIGGDDFVQAMVLAVQSVIQHPIPQGCVKQKSSSGGKYVSVNIGPIEVVSSEQVQAVYNAMRRDDRMKYFF